MNDSNKQIAKNSIILYIRLLLTIIVGLWSSRILLHNLGFSDYGLYNVVGGVIAMFCFVNGSLTSAASRFITYYLNDNEKLKCIFSTIKAIHLLFALIIIILGETIGLWFVINKLNYPEEREFAVHCIYQFTIITSVLNIINTPYNALLVAHENMSIYATTAMASTLLRFIVTILIAFVPFDRLIFYAAAYMIILFAERVFLQVYLKCRYPESKVTIKMYKVEAKQILGFSFWNVNGNLAILCYTHGLNILLNIFYGSVVNAARGIAVQVQSIIVQFCSNFQMAVNPQIVKSYASQNLDRMHQLLIVSSKFSFFLLSIIIIPIIYNADIILKLWLGEVPRYTRGFVSIMLIISLISTLSNPIVASIHATGNIKKFQIYEGSILLTILPISYLIVKFFNVQPISVFLVNLVVAIIAQGIRIRIVLPRIEMNTKLYLQKVIVPITMFFGASNIVPYIVYRYLPHDIYTSCFSVFLSVVYSIFTAYFIGCNKEERIYLFSKLKSFYDKTYGKK